MRTPLQSVFPRIARNGRPFQRLNQLTRQRTISSPSDSKDSHGGRTYIQIDHDHSLPAANGREQKRIRNQPQNGESKTETRHELNHNHKTGEDRAMISYHRMKWRVNELQCHGRESGSSTGESRARED